MSTPTERLTYGTNASCVHVRPSFISASSYGPESRSSLGHYGLRKGGVHHRNISAMNPMYYRADGKTVGAMNNLDLQLWRAQTLRKFGNKRTETVPSMAIKLFDETRQSGFVTHKYHHEIEAFIWVLAWISCECKENGTHRGGFLHQLGQVGAMHQVRKGQV